MDTTYGSSRRIDGYAPIGAYAAIGDGKSVALVASDGSIDWLSLPALAAPSVLGALLDPAAGGSFSVAPAVPFESERRYLEHTNVLETTFRTADGTLRVTDAMTRPAGESSPGREIVRKVDGVSGRVPVRSRLKPRFDYGSEDARWERRGRAFVASSERAQVAFQAWDAGDVGVSQGAVETEFVAEEGSHALLTLLGTLPGPVMLPDRESVERRLEQTVEYWRRWVGRSRYDGDWGDAVERSLLALALLADDGTGAIAAAGTTSLPEAIGGSRNYDYRFAWARDLSFTLDALLQTGFDDLAHKSFTWLLSATRHTHPRIDPVYGLDGVPLRSQTKLGMPGYRLSGPVHGGNKAGTQLQLGGFGDLLETTSLYVRQGGLLDREAGERVADVADLLERIWRKQDAGLWELGDYQQYTTSKLSCWTAFDRVLKLADTGQVPRRHVGRWREARDDVAAFIEQRLWSERKRSYVMREGSDALDAGTLLAARRGFGDRKRISATIDAVRAELDAGAPLLYRYTGMSEQENAFLACSCWCVEALARVGRVDEAAETMDALVGLSNDVGLFSEEMEPASKALRGNFPQALTHLALINAAVMFEQGRRGQYEPNSEREDQLQ